MDTFLNIPYEYCAQQYLLFWENREKKMHKYMSGAPTSDEIRYTLKHYSIARNFKGLAEDHVAIKIAHELLYVSNKNGGDISDKVIDLATRFEKHFNKFNLSAASKLLWLRHKRPYLIYDSRALSAL